MVPTSLIGVAFLVLALHFGAVESLRKRRQHLTQVQGKSYKDILEEARAAESGPGALARKPPSAQPASSERFAADARLVNQQRATWPGEHGNIRTGLAVSGGGSRALSFTSGVLRALVNLGLMDKIEAISSVSGGGWAAAPFMFQKKYGVTELLGAPSNFSELTLEELTKPKARINDGIAEGTNGALAWMAVRYPFRSLWERMMERFILGPFDLGDRSTFIAANESHVADIIRRNPQLRFEDFQTPYPGRPKVYIMNGIVTCPDGYTQVLADSVPFQVSPDFAGTPFWSKYNDERREPEPIQYAGTWLVRPDTEMFLGGGLLETFAIGGTSPSSQDTDGPITVGRPEHTMSLATSLAISSGPVSQPVRHIFPFLPEGGGASTKYLADGKDMYLADAGCTDNSGLLALMQRRVTRAVSVISGQSKINLTMDFCNPESHTDEEWYDIIASGDHTPETLSSMFGFRFNWLLEDRKNVHVFPKDMVLPIMCHVQGLKKAGKPVVFKKTLPIIENRWHGIEGGFDMTIVFVVLQSTTDFDQSLPESMQEELRENSMFSEHPNYGTFEHFDTMYLKRPISNLLAAQAEYSVRMNEELFRELLD